MNLNPVPANLAETRSALHHLAFFAVSPARHKAVGRMGLKDTPGGFGTPEFDGRVARIDGDLLVHEDNGNVATQKITTVREAAEFFGNDYDQDWFADWHDPVKPDDPDATLDVDGDASHFLGEWFKYGFEVLNSLRGHGVDGDDVSEAQLWPEHFDPATELGDYDKGERASFGASPGDGNHPEPYLYVAAWSEVDRSNAYWNEETFNGASLSYGEIKDSDDPLQTGLDFLLEGYRILHGG
ncbi:MAG: hypothetical protein U9N56_05395 [Actinomycetota bacterium]|nr:hypothetical protein [Actinomycetota bacterium]